MKVSPSETGIFESAYGKINIGNRLNNNKKRRVYNMSVFLSQAFAAHANVTGAATVMNKLGDINNFPDVSKQFSIAATTNQPAAAPVFIPGFNND